METKVSFIPLTRNRYRIVIDGKPMKGKAGITKNPKRARRILSLPVRLGKKDTEYDDFYRPSKGEITEKSLRGFFWSEIQHRIIHY